jgi:hypothetical protein
MRCFLFIVVGLAALTASTTRAAGPVAAGFPGFETIRAADLMKTVEYLASPPLAGRMAGSPGYLAAARESATRFRRLGLKPAGDDGFFQRLDVEYAEIDTCRLALVLSDGATRELKLGPDFVARGWTGSGDFTAPLVFAGYGVSVPERGYDDYAGLDVRGKVVLAFKGAPPFHPAAAPGTDRGRARRTGPAPGGVRRPGGPDEAHRQRARRPGATGRAIPATDGGCPRRTGDAGHHGVAARGPEGRDRLDPAAAVA